MKPKPKAKTLAEPLKTRGVPFAHFVAGKKNKRATNAAGRRTARREAITLDPNALARLLENS
jgi:hypothetical protein